MKIVCGCESMRGGRIIDKVGVSVAAMEFSICVPGEGRGQV